MHRVRIHLSSLLALVLLPGCIGAVEGVTPPAADPGPGVLHKLEERHVSKDLQLERTKQLVWELCEVGHAAREVSVALDEYAIAHGSYTEAKQKASSEKNPAKKQELEKVKAEAHVAVRDAGLLVLDAMFVAEMLSNRVDDGCLAKGLDQSSFFEPRDACGEPWSDVATEWNSGASEAKQKLAEKEPPDALVLRATIDPLVSRTQTVAVGDLDTCAQFPPKEDDLLSVGMRVQPVDLGATPTMWPNLVLWDIIADLRHHQKSVRRKDFSVTPHVPEAGRLPVTIVIEHARKGAVARSERYLAQHPAVVRSELHGAKIYVEIDTLFRGPRGTWDYECIAATTNMRTGLGTFTVDRHGAGAYIAKRDRVAHIVEVRECNFCLASDLFVVGTTGFVCAEFEAWTRKKIELRGAGHTCTITAREEG